MSRMQAGLFGGLAALAVFIGVLVMRNPKPPFMPADEDHRSFATCNECHAMDGPIPRSTEHPIGEDCNRCHAMR
jgi:hypothetical protein